MICHFTGTSLYVKRYIRFLIENKNHFDLDKHFFIVNDNGTSKLDEELFQNINYIRISSKWGFVSVLNKLSTNDKLILHGLFNPRLLIYLYFKKKLIKQCTWSIWGGDVYFYKYKNNGLKHNLIEFLRKKVISKIPVITSLVKGDYEIVRKVYGSNAKYIYSFYPNPVDFSLIENIPNKKEHEGTKIIMVGNSGDPANNHKEVFEMLKRFKEEDIKIICSLSYGSPEYISSTINYGQKLFGSRFIPFTKFIQPEEYIKILADVDVAIMNHNRQQGLGNIIALLALKKKVYIPSDTSSYQFFSDKGVDIFNTSNLKDVSLNDLFHFEKSDAEKNKKIIENLFSNGSAYMGWSEVFYEI